MAKEKIAKSPNTMISEDLENLGLRNPDTRLPHPIVVLDHQTMGPTCVRNSLGKCKLIVPFSS